VRGDDDDLLDIAANLNDKWNEENKLSHFKRNDSGLFDKPNENDIQKSESTISEPNSPKQNLFSNITDGVKKSLINQSPAFFKKLGEETFAPDLDMNDDLIAALNPRAPNLSNYNKLKHIFEVKIVELKNVPILSKILWELERNEKDSIGQRMSSKYI